MGNVTNSLLVGIQVRFKLENTIAMDMLKSTERNSFLSITDANFIPARFARLSDSFRMMNFLERFSLPSRKISK